MSNPSRWQLRFPIAPGRIAALGVAAMLLALAATLAQVVNFSRAANPVALIAFACFLAGYALCFALALDLPAARWNGLRSRVSPVWTRRLRFTATLVMLALVSLTALLLIGFLYTLLFEPLAHAYWNDVISFNAANAQAVLSGRNPYTDDANFLPTLLRYSSAPPTPIQGPIFGYGYNYPLQPHVFAVDKAYLRDPAAYASAFDPATLHSYPALSFLLVIPLVALGLNIVWLHMLAYVGIFAWLVTLAPRAQRGWVAFAAAATLTIPLNTLMIDTEIICLVFLLVAWRYRERRWLSALALGLGCAFKQYCWLFAPFYLLDALLRYGWREALRRAGIVVAAFLAPNLPFILLNPRAWLTSVLLPVSAPLFPQGMGIVTLSLGRLAPGWPPLFYLVAEALAFVAALWLYARFRAILGEAALLLALTPLIFAFRSPANYFAILPWLALYAMLTLQRRHAEAAALAPSAAPVAAASGGLSGALGGG